MWTPRRGGGGSKCCTHTHRLGYTHTCTVCWHERTHTHTREEKWVMGLWAEDKRCRLQATEGGRQVRQREAKRWPSLCFKGCSCIICIKDRQKKKFAERTCCLFQDCPASYSDRQTHSHSDLPSPASALPPFRNSKKTSAGPALSSPSVWLYQLIWSSYIWWNMGFLVDTKTSLLWIVRKVKWLNNCHIDIHLNLNASWSDCELLYLS